MPHLLQTAIFFSLPAELLELQAFTTITNLICSFEDCKWTYKWHWKRLTFWSPYHTGTLLDQLQPGIDDISKKARRPEANGQNLPAPCDVSEALKCGRLVLKGLARKSKFSLEHHLPCVHMERWWRYKKKGCFQWMKRIGLRGRYHSLAIVIVLFIYLSFVSFLLLCSMGVHCGIYERSYHISTIS